MKPLSSDERQYIISLLQAGHPYHKIAKATHRSHGTITNIRKKYLPDLQKSLGGCPAKLSDQDIHYAICLISFREADTAPQVARRLEAIKETTISDQTVRNYLGKAGYKSVGKKKQPYLKPSHCRARKDFAEKYLYWTVEDWKRVIWLDETKINRFGSDGKKWAWKKRGEHLSKCLI
jgi:transposase